MSKLRFFITVSLDGYIAGPNQSLEHGLGEGGEDLHEWMLGLKTFKEMHGDSGGEIGSDNDILAEAFENIGAVIMGRNMFGPVRGPWGDGEWKGWWGDNPPYHSPVFVLTHYEREPLEMEGSTTFHFITDGIKAALKRAKEAAKGKDVSLGGGASVAQQYLSAGLMDEMDLHIVPMLLGGGTRLLDNIDTSGVSLRQVRTLEGAGVTHVKYRIAR